jgi:hypothetical protein
MIAAALAALLVSAPGAIASQVGGTPLDVVSYVALGLACCIGAAAVFFPPRRAPGLWLPLTLLKVLVGREDVAAGWRAVYRYADTTGAMHDARFFWRLASRPYRVEPVIGLSDVRSDLHFFNDVDLYGYPPYDGTPRETKFLLEVTWTGYVDVQDKVSAVWLVTAMGSVSVTTPAGTQVLDQPKGARVDVALGPGLQALSLTYTKPAAQPPFIKALIVDGATGRVLPVRTSPEAVRPWAAPATSAIVWVGLALLGGAFGTALARTGTTAAAASLVTRAAGLAATVFLVGWGTVLATATYGSTSFFGAGGDPLYYGSSARDILHGGPLMLHGAPLGQASPFYFYPMYPYVLALGHVLVGESVSAIYLVNGFLVAMLPALFLALGWFQLRALAGVVAFASLTAFLWVYGSIVITFEQPAFTDIAYMTLVFMALVAFARACATPTRIRLVVAGVLIAFGAATRPSLMTLVYLAPFGLAGALGVRSPKRWLVASAWLAAGVALGLLPFTLRNGIAAGRFVVLVNSWIQIPYFLIPPEIPEKPGGMPGLLEALGMAWVIFLEYPVRTIVVEVRKVLYTLGVTAVGPPGMLQGHALAVLPVLFGAAVAARRLSGPTAIAVVTFAVSHLLAMVVAAPWTFHYKSILPLHAAFLFGAAFLLDRPAGRAVAPVTPG